MLPIGIVPLEVSEPMRKESELYEKPARKTEKVRRTKLVIKLVKLNIEMDTRKLGKPIVMAKPVRGREMQSTFIPKDVVETVRAVSAKKVRGDSMVENLQKPREGEMEVYHEGYVDGKLYLVPDTNLQAMRDIVNLKMRRRYSSTEKPQTSLDEPTQYSEFKSKLDGLLEKVDQLAESSCDETASLGSTHSRRGLEKKKKRISKKQVNKTKNTLKKQSTVSVLKNKPEGKDTESENPRINKTADKKKRISPMLDDNISYIKVRPKDQIESRKPVRGPYSFDLPAEAHNQDSVKELEERLKEQVTENFHLLISGHLRNGIVPTFIVHQNYAGLNVLETDLPDFKTHKKEGNIDIFISGKFFTGNILKEESSESPAILDIKPNKIMIDKKNDVHRRKFKDIYKVGPLEVGLEGEFKKDSKTLKYTPVFSLNIVKSSLDVTKNLHKNKSDNYSHTNVFFTQQNYKTPFRLEHEDKKAEQKTSKHVHYASGNREINDTHSKKGKHATNKSVLSLLKNNMIYKRFFSKANHRNYDDSLENETSSQQLRARSSKAKREELARLRKSRLIDRRNKRGQTKKLVPLCQEESTSNTLKVGTTQQLFRCETTAPGEVQAWPTLTITEPENLADTNLETKKVRKVRKKKKDKNQAIVENPILAQMQEFFIA